MPIFDLKSKHAPAGDQPKAINKLVAGLDAGMAKQTLLGVTGSGKTFTMANVIAQARKPTLVIAHNKTLAAQLCNEFRELFPNNAVHYFVSYYDYYQPEAYMPITDTYIEKEAMINEEIDRLRHAATMSLLTRKDTIIVASVSCIYGLGAPERYRENILFFNVGLAIERASLVKKLINLQFKRTTADLTRGTFRLRGDQWEIMPANEEVIYNLRVQNGYISEILAINPVEGVTKSTPSVDTVAIAPAKHFITEGVDRERAIKAIQAELKTQLAKFEKEGKLLEAERIERRTKFDLAMIREVGYCSGIENYSMHLSGRQPGDSPDSLLSYFPQVDEVSPPTTQAANRAAGGGLSSSTSRGNGLAPFPDFLTIIDESHITLPQIRGMYFGDQARKKTLIEYGFRLPSAAENRPLRYEEFEAKIGQVVYTSATPGEEELKESAQVAEQIIRPTGLVDPEIILSPARGQIEDLKKRLDPVILKKERIMITTLTKKMAEDLSAYLEEKKYKAAYLHSDVKTFDRIKILTEFRKGKYDVLVGVNLLREGLDLPEVSLVAILDADKEGFLRSETSLIQTIGRAARNVSGQVILYGDIMTGSMQKALDVTNKRRTLQLAYNKEHGITPKTIIKEIKDILPEEVLNLELKPVPKTTRALEKLIKEKEREMKEAAKQLDFELAALLRDEVKTLTKDLHELGKEAEKDKKV
ncbi:MAG: excinuclease ABC subunit UvrB [Candidatus Paceibacterota bacterium]|jgi:excinuclease ABC subunit B